MDGITAPAGRRFAPVVGREWWERCALAGTIVDPVTGEVLLARRPAGPAVPWPADPGPPVERAGLGFDGHGRLYRGVPERGQIQRMAWPRRGEAPVDLLVGPEPPAGGGGFVPSGADPRRPLRARALAADFDEHLFLLDGALARITVLDLADGHLLRSVALAWTPVDLAAAGDGSALVATASRPHLLVRLDAIGVPAEVPVETYSALAAVPPGAQPSRVAVGPDDAVWLLLRDGPDAWVLPLRGATLATPLRVPGGTDLEIDGEGRVVVAGPAGYGLLTWAVAGGTATPDVPLLARGYDGRGIARTPDGRIGFWNGTTFRAAVAERVRYGEPGTVDTYQMDSQTYRQQWGRVFVEACVPPDTELRVGSATADEAPEALGDPPPEATAALAQVQRLHRRENGRELPWAPFDPGDRFEVYEAPITAPPGRYLWLRLQLTGSGAATPRVRAVRAEFPGHDLVERLPRTYRRDAVAAAFLRRYLGMIDGLLSEIEDRAVQRDLLLDPWSAPPEMLDWLASLIGLTLDGRWPEPARRTVLTEAICLFRRRGTVAGLRRLLEIYLDCPVVILEAFRLRGTGGAFVGGQHDEPGPAAAVVGAGLRVGGEVRDADLDTGLVADAFRTHAHRFSVLITRDLDDDQLAVVRDLLDLHRPAHTLVDICTVGQGMRVGVSLHVGISTIVGPSSGLQPVLVGSAALGRGSVLGRGRAGVRVGAARLGSGTVIDT